MPARDYLTYVGAYGISVDDTGRMLLARVREDTPDDGKWTLPGGGLLYGETPDDAVRREVEEETGLVCEIEDLLGTSVMTIERSSAFDGARLHYIGILYRVRIVGGSLRAEIDGTTDACGWFSRPEIGTMTLVDIVERDALPFAFPDRAG